MTKLVEIDHVGYSEECPNGFVLGKFKMLI
jgi:hypothetical protein